MRVFMRAAVIVFTIWTLSSPMHAACGPGNEGCEPSENEVRAKIERLLDSAYLTPHAIISLEKLDGRSIEMRDRNVYEMRILAVMNYSGDKLRCRTPFCPEMLNYSVEIDEEAKKAKIAGWLLFEKTDQDWR